MSLLEKKLPSSKNKSTSFVSVRENGSKTLMLFREPTLFLSVLVKVQILPHFVSHLYQFALCCCVRYFSKTTTHKPKFTTAPLSSGCFVPRGISYVVRLPYFCFRSYNLMAYFVDNVAKKNASSLTSAREKIRKKRGEVAGTALISNVLLLSGAKTRPDVLSVEPRTTTDW